MNDKLEKLAMNVKRPTAWIDEWGDPDCMMKLAQAKENQDRIKGNFPYDDDSVQGVKDFYTGKDILITGGTGFIGKVLIEKILRSLPEGGRIFLLLRGRKELSPQQRVHSMLELPLFKLLMTENPDAAERLVVIEGDCSAVGLGLSQSDRQTLIENVSIVFHCAASVRFDLTTNHMMIINVRGTRDVVHLCRDMKKLDAFVHVSTAFSNATKDRTTPIPEEVVPQEIDWKTVLAVTEKLEKAGNKQAPLDLIFQKLTTKHQNNYTFTKALAESVIAEEAQSLPVVIVRPSVVVASYEDPFGGWVDNLYGPMSIWEAVGQGIIRTHYGNGSLALDYLPVDMSAKTLIVAAWHRGIGFRLRSNPEEVDVVNNGTKDFTYNSYDLLNSKKQKLFDKYSHRYIFRHPRCLITDIFWLFWIITIFSHIPLGIVVDTALRIMGRKPMLLSIYRRIYFAQIKLLHHFSTKSFDFDLECQWQLNSRIPKADKERFDRLVAFFPLAYYQDNIAGLIKYVFKEKPYSAEQSNKIIMHYLDWIHNGFLVALGLWILSRFLWINSTVASK